LLDKEIEMNAYSRFKMRTSDKGKHWVHNRAEAAAFAALDWFKQNDKLMVLEGREEEKVTRVDELVAHIGRAIGRHAQAPVPEEGLERMWLVVLLFGLIVGGVLGYGARDLSPTLAAFLTLQH
jgi:hypothetical protein